MGLRKQEWIIQAKAGLKRLSKPIFQKKKAKFLNKIIKYGISEDVGDQS